MTASSSSAQRQPTESSASMPSATSYVLQDAPDDTPHAMHPHAAAYVTAQQAAAPEAPARVRTLRQMTPEERTAWMAMQNLRPSYVPEVPEQATAFSASAPSATDYAPPGHGRPSTPWGAATAYQPSPQPSPPLPSSPNVDVEMTYSTPSAPTGPVDSPPAPAPAVARPVRTSSLQAGPASRALAQITDAGMRPGDSLRTPELEIVVSRPGGQDITLRLFAPGRV